MSSQQFHNPYSNPTILVEDIDPFWKSESAPKLLASTIQTVAVSSLSSDQYPSGSVDLSIQCGRSQGLHSQAYIKLNVDVTVAGAGTCDLQFGGGSFLGTSLVSSYRTNINGVALDTISNFPQVASDLINHMTSNDWVLSDGYQLFNACGKRVGVSAGTQTYCLVIPLFGALAQPVIPLALMNGTLNINLQLNTIAGAFYVSNQAGGTPTVTNFRVYGVQYIADKIMPDPAYFDSVMAEMATGNKFIMPFVNIQSNSQAISTGTSNISYGVSLSSLRGVLMSQVATADLTSATAAKFSVPNSLSRFQILSDGRLMSSVNYNMATSKAVCFLESNKALSRFLSSDTSDVCTRVGADGIIGSNAEDLYLSENWFVAQNCMRSYNSALSWAGTQCGNLNVQFDTAGGNYTVFIHILSDRQLLIDGNGNVEVKM